MTNCEHARTITHALVERLEPLDDGPPRFVVAIRVTCALCGVAFRFVGVENDVRDLEHPAVTEDETRIVLPLAPSSAPSPVLH